MQVSPTIFREYDIRGIVGKNLSHQEIAKYEKWYGRFPGVTLSLEVGEAIGKAYGTIIRKTGGKKVLVGFELRPFAKELTDSFVAGVRSTGCDVLFAGISLTPLIYFGTAFFNLDGGVNVTGSHNLYFYNGFKLMKKGVYPLFGRELQELRKMVESEDFFESKEPGSLQDFNVFDPYEAYLEKHIKLSRTIKVVVDAGNGSAGIFAPKILRRLGCEVIELHTDPDPTFPNHIPDPEDSRNTADLGEKVRDFAADLGIAFDTDGDRVGFVNEKGELVNANFILLLLAKDVLRRHPGKKILYDVKSSQLLEELIPLYGGVPLMHKTGHGPIKETLRKDPDIVLGGESSGHFFFVEDYFKIDDAIFAAGKVLEIFANTKKKFSELFYDIPLRIQTPEFKLPCEDEKKFQIVEKITASLQKRFPSKTIDGIRIQLTPTSWGLIRASNTSPYITVRVEGKNKEEVLKVKNILADELEKFPEVKDKLDRTQIASNTGKLGWV